LQRRFPKKKKGSKKEKNVPLVTSSWKVSVAKKKREGGSQKIVTPIQSGSNGGVTPTRSPIFRSEPRRKKDTFFLPALTTAQGRGSANRGKGKRYLL